MSNKNANPQFLAIEAFELQCSDETAHSFARGAPVELTSFNDDLYVKYTQQETVNKLVNKKTKSIQQVEQTRTGYIEIPTRALMEQLFGVIVSVSEELEEHVEMVKCDLLDLMDFEDMSVIELTELLGNSLLETKVEGSPSERKMPMKKRKKKVSAATKAKLAKAAKKAARDPKVKAKRAKTLKKNKGKSSKQRAKLRLQKRRKGEATNPLSTHLIQWELLEADINLNVIAKLLPHKIFVAANKIKVTDDTMTIPSANLKEEDLKKVISEVGLDCELEVKDSSYVLTFAKKECVVKYDETASGVQIRIEPLKEEGDDDEEKPDDDKKKADEPEGDEDDSDEDDSDEDETSDDDSDEDEEKKEDEDSDEDSDEDDSDEDEDSDDDSEDDDSEDEDEEKSDDDSEDSDEEESKSERTRW